MQLRLAHLLRPASACRLELLRRGSLEAVDRLLGIADREERAHALAVRAGAGGEILGDLAQDLPLLGVRVLRLVDQHVVDAAIELVEHPGRVAAREQRQRLVDEILEVERAETRLRAARRAMWISAASVKRAPRALGGARGLALVDERDDAVLLGEQRVLQARADMPW